MSIKLKLHKVLINQSFTYCFHLTGSFHGKKEKKKKLQTQTKSKCPFNDSPSLIQQKMKVRWGRKPSTAWLQVFPATPSSNKSKTKAGEGPLCLHQFTPKKPNPKPKPTETPQHF